MRKAYYKSIDGPVKKASAFDKVTPLKHQLLTKAEDEKVNKVYHRSLYLKDGFENLTDNLGSKPASKPVIGFKGN